MSELRIAVGCDHGAYVLKDKIVAHLEKNNVNVTDYGTFGPESVNYPVYARAVCRAVQSGQADYGILLCTTGIGMSIAANKFRGIRAALCTNGYQAFLTRAHNNANVLVLGAGVTGEGMSLDIVDTFLAAEFQGGRHSVRLGMISDIEKEEYED
ncbi:MAG: ribose 5-phosphate isomerase B [Clostridia bacterium]|nr:ribose 5-phosphate isomerase B [Clostridia bacterium]